MPGGGLRGHGELPLLGEINVTSLVDVAFVLLIIFVITAPIMQGGVDVQLPVAEARPLDPKQGLVVSIDVSGRIFVDDTELTLDEMRTTFRAMVQRRGPDGVYLRADRRVAYGVIVPVLSIIQGAGIEGTLGLVAEQETIQR